MKRLVTSTLVMPEGLAHANAGTLLGHNYCFHDSFQLARRYDNAVLVLGFLYDSSEFYPHAWIQMDGIDIDPTNNGPGPRIALYHWTHKDCRDHVADSPAVVGGRAVVPPRVNRAGDIVFTEVDCHDKECLSQVDTERAARLREELLGMI
jgi:hypothetical protein